MNFKLDENLSPSLAEIFVAAGHDAHSVVQQALGGQPAVVEAAIRRVLTLLPQEALAGMLWIVEEHRIRIHE